jgi:transposase
MDQGAAMLAALFERSMNLEPEWMLVDTGSRTVEVGKGELHIFIERTPGHTVECLGCGIRRGAYDTREREWRHPDILQYKTMIHCDVPRADCPDCGPLAIKVPQECDSCL